MLTHYPSTVTVFQSPEYKNFVMINGNRSINLKKINRIIADIESGNDMLKDYPINVRVVKEKMEILDGQHRFFICKKLKRPVHYIIVNENKTIVDIAKVNSNVEKWKRTDFISCYITHGNKDYIRLQKYLDAYKINIGTSLRLLSDGNPGNEGTNGTLIKDFENGKFKINHWDAALEHAEDCKKFEASPNWRDRAFIIALFRIKKAGKISIDELVSAFNKRPEMLTKQGSQKGYVYNLEQIVNVGKQKRIVIL